MRTWFTKKQIWERYFSYALDTSKTNDSILVFGKGLEMYINIKGVEFSSFDMKTIDTLELCCMTVM